MAVGTHRLFRYRMTHPGDGCPLPEPGDFMVTARATYRILRADLARDAVESWCNGGWPDEEGGIPEGMICHVVHFRIGCVRVEPGERPADAMTWYAGRSDKRSHRHD